MKTLFTILILLFALNGISQETTPVINDTIQSYYETCFRTDTVNLLQQTNVIWFLITEDGHKYPWYGKPGILKQTGSLTFSDEFNREFLREINYNTTTKVKEKEFSYEGFVLYRDSLRAITD